MYFTTFHELNRSHLMVHCQASEERFQFKGNLEVNLEVTLFNTLPPC